MSKRVDSVSLLDMLSYARKVMERLQGVTFAEWNGDETLRSAVAYWVQTIGEAASKVSAETRAAHPQIEWLDIINMRHRIVHGYGLVDSDRVWNAAVNELQPLIAALEQMLPPGKINSGQ